jgi:hypothetical protein
MVTPEQVADSGPIYERIVLDTSTIDDMVILEVAGTLKEALKSLDLEQQAENAAWSVASAQSVSRRAAEDSVSAARKNLNDLIEQVALPDGLTNGPSTFGGWNPR